MSLSDLVRGFNFGELCQATALGMLLSCSGNGVISLNSSQSIATEPEKDTFPPYIELGIVGNGPFGTEPTLDINVDDKSPILKSEIQIAPGLVRSQMKEKSAVPERYSSDLNRIELYENGKLVDTIHPSYSSSLMYVGIDVKHRNGNFEYKVIAYDNAGNKSESASLAILIRDGLYFSRDALTRDKIGPKIKELNLIGANVLAWIEDDGSCVREVRVYEQDSHTLIHKAQSGSAVPYFDFQWKGMQIGHSYQLEAQDHAGNITRSAIITMARE